MILTEALDIVEGWQKRAGTMFRAGADAVPMTGQELSALAMVTTALLRAEVRAEAASDDEGGPS